jgi:hypothetical protein
MDSGFRITRQEMTDEALSVRLCDLAERGNRVVAIRRRGRRYARAFGLTLRSGPAHVMPLRPIGVEGIAKGPQQLMDGFGQVLAHDALRGRFAVPRRWRAGVVARLTEAAHLCCEVSAKNH